MHATDLRSSPPYLPFCALMLRFWRSIGPDDAPSRCWLWKGSKTSQGYGVLHVPSPKGIKNILAHRIALALQLGRWPNDCEKACHSCNTRNCVNPRHLYSGNQSDNVIDAIRAGTYKTHRVEGYKHERRTFSDDAARKILALYFGPDGNAYHFDRYRNNVKWTIKTLAIKFGTTTTVVRSIVREGVKQRTTFNKKTQSRILHLFFGRDGQGYGNKVRMYRGRWTNAAIASKFKVPVHCVSSLTYGCTYREIPRPFYDHNWKRLGRIGRSTRGPQLRPTR